MVCVWPPYSKKNLSFTKDVVEWCFGLVVGWWNDKSLYGSWVSQWELYVEFPTNHFLPWNKRNNCTACCKKAYWLLVAMGIWEKKITVWPTSSPWPQPFWVVEGGRSMSVGGSIPQNSGPGRHNCPQITYGQKMYVDSQVKGLKELRWS